jgi:hypothetical protein
VQRHAGGNDTIVGEAPDRANVQADAVDLSCLKGVARLVAVLYDDDGSCLLTAEMPYDAMSLVARCSQQEVELFVRAIA